jgi:hypothetical protein
VKKKKRGGGEGGRKEVGKVSTLKLKNINVNIFIWKINIYCYVWFRYCKFKKLFVPCWIFEVGLVSLKRNL